MKHYRVDCSTITTFQDFINAMNDAFIRDAGGDWNGHLDAFNDYLSWPKDVPYAIELVDHAKLARALDHQTMAERLRSILTTCHPDNASRVEAELELAESGEGQTLFDVIIEIITDEQNFEFVHLILDWPRRSNNGRHSGDMSPTQPFRLPR
jgi:hypothetical protein